MAKQLKHLGLRHLALLVNHFEACEHFYTGLLAMRVEWRPDQDNVYLTSGYDNLALHRAKQPFQSIAGQTENGRIQQTDSRLDHIGFIVETSELVDRWYDFLLSQRVKIHKKLKQHRDGAKSFYCFDPDSNIIQMIYHPPLSIHCKSYN